MGARGKIWKECSPNVSNAGIAPKVADFEPAMLLYALLEAFETPCSPGIFT
jgi:hypothetical protein